MTKKKPKISYADLGQGSGVGDQGSAPPTPPKPVAEAKPVAQPAPETPKRGAKPRPPKVKAEELEPLPPPVKAPEVVPEVQLKARISSPVEIAAILRTSPAQGIPAFEPPALVPTASEPEAAEGEGLTPDPRPLTPATDAPASIDDYAATLMRRLAAMAPVEVDDETEIERDTRPLRDRLRGREGIADLLMFRIGPEIFATELAMVEEAVALPEIHHLPEMPAAMLGAFNLRGRLTPVYSPAHVIGVPLRGTAQAALLVRANGRRLGLAVDDVEDVLQVDLATVREAPGIDDADGILLGVAHHGQELVAVLDAAALVAACLTGHAMETA